MTLATTAYVFITVNVNLIEKMTRPIDRSRSRRFRLIAAVVFVMFNTYGVIMHRVDPQVPRPPTLNFIDHCEEYCLGDSRFATSILHRLNCLCTPWHYAQRGQEETVLKYQPYQLHETMRKPHNNIRQVSSVPSNGVYFTGSNSPLDINAWAKQAQQRNPIYKPLETRLNLGVSALPEISYNYYNQNFQPTRQNYPYHVQQFHNPKMSFTPYKASAMGYTESAAIMKTHNIYRDAILAVTTSTDKEFILDIGIRVSNAAEKIGLIGIKDIGDLSRLLDSLGTGEGEEDFQKCISLYDALGNEFDSDRHSSGISYHGNGKHHTDRIYDYNLHNKPITSIRSYHADILNKCNSIVKFDNKNVNSFVKDQIQERLIESTSTMTAKNSHIYSEIKYSIKSDSVMNTPKLSKMLNNIRYPTNGKENSSKVYSISKENEFKTSAEIKTTKLNFQEPNGKVTIYNSHYNDNNNNNNVEKDKIALEENRRKMIFADIKTEPTLRITSFGLINDDEMSANNGNDLKKHEAALEANNKSTYSLGNYSQNTTVKINILGITKREKYEDSQEGDMYITSEKRDELLNINETSNYLKIPRKIVNSKTGEKLNPELHIIYMDTSDADQLTSKKTKMFAETHDILAISTRSLYYYNDNETGIKINDKYDNEATVKDLIALEANRRSMNWSKGQNKTIGIIDSNGKKKFKEEGESSEPGNYSISNDNNLSIIITNSSKYLHIKNKVTYPNQHLNKTSQTVYASSKENNYDKNDYKNIEESTLILSFEETTLSFLRNNSEVSSKLENDPNALENSDKRFIFSETVTALVNSDNISKKKNDRQTFETENNNLFVPTDKPAVITNFSKHLKIPRLAEYLNSNQENTSEIQYGISKILPILNIDKLETSYKSQTPFFSKRTDIVKKYEGISHINFEISSKREKDPNVDKFSDGSMNYIENKTIKIFGNEEKPKINDVDLENDYIALDVTNSIISGSDINTDPSSTVNHVEDVETSLTENYVVFNKNDKPIIPVNSSKINTQSLNSYYYVKSTNQAPHIFSKENKNNIYEFKTSDKITTRISNDQEYTNKLEQSTSKIHNNTEISNKLKNDPINLEANDRSIDLSEIESKPTFVSSHKTYANNDIVNNHYLFNISRKNAYGFDNRQKTNYTETKSPNEQVSILAKNYTDQFKILNYPSNTNNNSSQLDYLPENYYVSQFVNDTDKDETILSIQTNYKTSSSSVETGSLYKEHDQGIQSTLVINTFIEFITSAYPPNIKSNSNLITYNYSQSPSYSEIEHQPFVLNPFINKIENILDDNEYTNQVTNQFKSPSSSSIPDNMMDRNKIDRSWVHILESQNSATSKSKENNQQQQTIPRTDEKIIYAYQNLYTTENNLDITKASHNVNINEYGNKLDKQTLHKESKNFKFTPNVNLLGAHNILSFNSTYKRMPHTQTSDDITNSDDLNIEIQNYFPDIKIPEKKNKSANSVNNFLNDTTINTNELNTKKIIQLPQYFSNSSEVPTNVNTSISSSLDDKSSSLTSIYDIEISTTRINYIDDKEVVEPRIFDDDEDLSMELLHSKKNNQTESFQYKSNTKTSLENIELSHENLNENQTKNQISLTNLTQNLNLNNEINKSLNRFDNTRRKYISKQKNQNNQNEMKSSRYNKGTNDESSFLTETEITNIRPTSSGEILSSIVTFDMPIKTVTDKVTESSAITNFDSQTVDKQFKNNILDSESQNEEEHFDSKLKSEDTEFDSTIQYHNAKFDKMQPDTNHKIIEDQNHNIEMENLSSNNEENTEYDQYGNDDIYYQPSNDKETTDLITTVLPENMNLLQQPNNSQKSNCNTKNEDKNLVPQWPYLRGKIYFVSDNVKIPLQFIQYNDGNIKIAFDGLSACKDENNIPVSHILRIICQSIQKGSKEKNKTKAYYDL